MTIEPQIKTHNAAEEAFLDARIAHDLTHMYSDDSMVYRRGMQSLARIHEKARKLGDEERAKQIFDAVVDTKLIPSARGQFYWLIKREVR